MPKTRVFRTDEIEGAILATPSGHEHLRLALFIKGNQTLIFPEAVVAALARAYVYLKTHPTCETVALKARTLNVKKSGYAATQLLETKHSAPETQHSLAELLKAASVSAPTQT